MKKANRPKKRRKAKAKPAVSYRRFDATLGHREWAKMVERRKRRPPMLRYLLFGAAAMGFSGGADDFVLDFSSVSVAKRIGARWLSLKGSGWLQIIDTRTGMSRSFVTGPGWHKPESVYGATNGELPVRDPRQT